MLITSDVVATLSVEEAISLFLSGMACGIPGEWYATKERAFRADKNGIFHELTGQKCIACGWLIPISDLPEEFKGHPPECPCCDRKMSLHVKCGNCGAKNKVVWVS